jgi:hypothetical protein
VTAAPDGQYGNALPGPQELRALVREILREVLRDELREVVREVARDVLPAGAAQRPAEAVRVDKGAVTERMVSVAAKNGHSLVLGPRAVLTPLGRDKARALGVHVRKER